MFVVVQGVQLKSVPYFNMSNLLTKIYKMLYSETCLTGPPIYRKPGQTENKFRNGVISYVK